MYVCMHIGLLSLSLSHTHTYTQAASRITRARTRTHTHTHAHTHTGCIKSTGSATVASKQPQGPSKDPDIQKNQMLRRKQHTSEEACKAWQNALAAALTQVQILMLKSSVSHWLMVCGLQALRRCARNKFTRLIVRRRVRQYFERWSFATFLE
jgi:hypothetical protein